MSMRDTRVLSRRQIVAGDADYLAWLAGSVRGDA